MGPAGQIHLIVSIKIVELKQSRLEASTDLGARKEALRETRETVAKIVTTEKGVEVELAKDQIPVLLAAQTLPWRAEPVCL